MQPEPGKPGISGPLYHRQSGKFSPAGLLLMLVAGAVVATVAGAIYGVAMSLLDAVSSGGIYLPGTLGMLLALGVGAAVGFAIGGAGRIGKVRNTPVLIVLTILCVSGAWYFSWVLWFARGGRLDLAPSSVIERLTRGIASGTLEPIWIISEAVLMFIAAVGILTGPMPPLSVNNATDGYSWTRSGRAGHCTSIRPNSANGWNRATRWPSIHSPATRPTVSGR